MSDKQYHIVLNEAEIKKIVHRMVIIDRLPGEVFYAITPTELQRHLLKSLTQSVAALDDSHNDSDDD